MPVCRNCKEYVKHEDNHTSNLTENWLCRIKEDKICPYCKYEIRTRTIYECSQECMMR